MSAEANKKLVSRIWHEIWNTGALDVVDDKNVDRGSRGSEQEAELLAKRLGKSGSDVIGGS